MDMTRSEVGWLMVGDRLIKKDHTLRIASAFVLCGMLLVSGVQAEGIADQLAALRKIQSGNENEQQAAAKTLRQLSSSNLDLLDVLRAMKGATPLGKNWLVGLANTLHRKSGSTSQDKLSTFLADASQDPEARYTVFRWLTDGNDELRTKLLDSMLEDPSLELRFDAVAQAIKKSEGADEKQWRRLLDSSRHPSQTAEIIEKLIGLKVEVDLASHMGFVKTWKLIGPFDNVGSDKFNVVYDVEPDWVAGKLKDSYAGKSGQATWIEHTTDNAEGQVDLAKLFNNEKGCVVYATAVIRTPSAIPCEVRVGCINAQKVWVNGVEVISNEVYHTGMQIDQYSAPITLKQGENRILVKICQNEQKEAWAQLYSFQLRLCDETGKAIALAQ
jgi:hypothetical protein